MTKLSFTIVTIHKPTMKTRTKYLLLITAFLCICASFIVFVIVHNKVVGEGDTYTKQYVVQPKEQLLLYTFICIQDRIGVNVQSTDIVDYFMINENNIVIKKNNVTTFLWNKHVPRGTKLFISNVTQKKVTVLISVDITCTFYVLVKVLGIMLILFVLIFLCTISILAYSSHIRNKYPHLYVMPIETPLLPIGINQNTYL